MRRFLWLLCLAYAAHTWAVGSVQLITSEAGGAYREVADAFQAALASRFPVREWTLAQLDDARLKEMSRGDDLIVPIGVKAARALASQYGGQAAVLTLMLPRSTAQQIPWSAGMPRNHLSHVYIDQPLSRVLDLVVALFPRAKRFGLVFSSENDAQVKALRREAARRHLGLALESVEHSEDVASALRSVLPDSDVLLLLPDSIAFRSGNAQNALLAAYRDRVPVVGFSQSLSKAGAVASVYSSPKQIGHEGGLMALQWKPGSGLPPAQYSEAFHIGFNPYVARSLGMELINLEEVRLKLGAANE